MSLDYRVEVTLSEKFYGKKCRPETVAKFNSRYDAVEYAKELARLNESYSRVAVFAYANRREPEWEHINP